MTCTVVVGAQFGDEGKGRIVDYLAAQANMVVRFQGGNNAGHTVMNELGTFRLHLVPSGIFYPKVKCVLGAGMVVDPTSLIEEISSLEAAGVNTNNLWIDRRAHIVWPYHRLLDGASEAKGELGTTKRGIGPVYGDKASYRGIRMSDLLHSGFLKERLARVLPIKNHEMAYYGLQPFKLEDLLTQAGEWRERLERRIIDSLPMIQQAESSGQRILLEGQLGAMRDLNWGIYPFSTASSPTAGGACEGAGIPPQKITNVIGIVKAYTTAVGGGPFPTELLDKDGQRLQQVGDEYGATTKRPRRCGWLDTVILRYAAALNGFTGIAITKLDVLDSFERAKICTGYTRNGITVNEMPDTVDLGEVKPVYEQWDGWKEPSTTARRWDDLPPNAQAYLRRVESLVNVPIRYISVGPQRENLIAM